VDFIWNSPGRNRHDSEQRVSIRVPPTAKPESDVAEPNTDKSFEVGKPIQIHFHRYLSE
jgi:hypothetical protein